MRREVLHVDEDCEGWLTFMRASGECLCEICGKEYYDHPFCGNSPSLDRSALYQNYVLHVLCDGTHIKT